MTVAARSGREAARCSSGRLTDGRIASQLQTEGDAIMPITRPEIIRLPGQEYFTIIAFQGF